MKFKNEVFDLLKWLALVCLPALQIAIPALFEAWGWTYGEPIGTTINIIAVLLGALLGVSNANYYKEKNDDSIKG